MAILQFANKAQTTLASSLSPTSTSLAVAAGTGGLFPTLSGAQSFYFTITNGAGGGSNNDEICLCTVHATASDTFATITRGQDGTSAESWTAGANVQMLCNAGTQRAFLQRDQNQQTPPIYGIAGGSVNAPTLAVSSGLSSLSDGMTVVFESTGANTGNMTFDLTLGSTDTGAVAIVTEADQNIPPLSIPRAGIPVMIVFSGALSSWVLAFPPPLATTAANGVVTLPLAADLHNSNSDHPLTPRLMIAGSTVSGNFFSTQLWDNILIQTGVVNSVSANSATTVTFPTAFLTGLGHANYSGSASDSLGNAMQFITSPSTTQMTIHNTSSVTQNLTWIATGT